LKTVKRILVGLLTSALLLWVLVSLKEFVTHTGCSALSVFDSGNLGQSIEILLTFILIYVTGFALYLLLVIWFDLKAFPFFILLTLVSSYELTFSIYRDITTTDENVAIKKSICEKATDDGMFCKFKNLNLSEYQFLTSGYEWIPQIPTSTQNINIDFYRDDFLGDYNLTITIKSTELDTSILSGWDLIETLDSGLFVYEHNQGES